ncbi:hypothetical protein HZS55_01545 [Halosimplex rubrum]|uniref:Uncharacterized protein n=1 Tax=Halosimplex rubrum TaxID=869889 RepID=A0A7D5SNW1_9EURY|nr:hypothetical protein [Halosimplex rubrum]QLH76067.1 hypothetical protein HZS55_01545 [Halosimplex rubrum]
MPDLTRRRALLAVASGAVTLAGCSDRESRPTIGRERRNRRIEDYEVRAVRSEDDAVLFAQGEQLPTATDERRRRYARSGREVVVSADDIAELTFGDGPEAERLRSFVDGTDFDSASVYLLAMPVEACYEIRLQSVSVEWDDIDTDDLHPSADFCRAYRPADVECDADGEHTVGFAIRLPVAAERSSGSGRGMSSSCRPNPEGESFHATVTPAEGGEE